MKIDTITYDDTKNCFSFSMNTGQTYWISYEAYMKFNLHKNQEITDEQKTLLETEDAHLRAYWIAFRYAHYQPRTESEVRRRLHREHLPQKEIEEVVQKLTQQHLLDDKSYASHYAEEKQTLHAWSRRKIAQHLYQKGIASEIVQSVLNSLVSDTEALALERLFQKKYSRRDLHNSKDYEKTFAALLRQGFSGADIRSLLQRARKKQSLGCTETEDGND